MKYCSNCGSKLIPGSKFCNECGSRIIPSVQPVVEKKKELIIPYIEPKDDKEISNEDTAKKEVTDPIVIESIYDLAVKPRTQAKCWTVFAKIGFGLGLGGLICSFIYTLGLTICLHGLVFSILGLRSYYAHNKAQAGLIMSIIGIVLGFAFSIACVVCLMFMTTDPTYGQNNYNSFSYIINLIF